ncbi:MAG: glycosyltransferase family 4 protein [Pseudomonadota bacterium]
MRPGVLLLLDSIVLYGRERGNIDVLQVLSENGTPVQVAVHEHWGRKHVVPQLEALKIAWTEVDYHDRLGRSTSAWQWLTALAVIARANLQLARLLRRESIGALQIASPRTLLNFLPLLWWTRTPLVFRCGDLPDVEGRARQWLWGQTLARVNSVVAISDFVARALVAAGCDPARLTVIRSRPFIRGAVATSEGGDRPSGSVVLGFAGQLAEHKGIADLLAAVRDLRGRGLDVSLVLAGEVTPAYEQLAGAAEPWRHEWGYLKDMAPFFAAVDLLVVPSRCNEALGAVVIEAKAAGVAAVVYPDGGLPEVVDDGVDGRVCPTADPAALTAALEPLVHNPGRIRQMGAAARAGAQSLGEQFGRCWREVYRELGIS